MNRCYKVWLESHDGKFILGEGTARLLHAVEEEGSLSGAVKSMGISYAHAWRKIREIEKNSGRKVVQRKRGGKTGGSSALTKEGRELLREYEDLKMKVGKAVQNTG